MQLLLILAFVIIPFNTLCLPGHVLSKAFRYLSVALVDVQPLESYARWK